MPQLVGKEPELNGNISDPFTKELQARVAALRESGHQREAWSVLVRVLQTEIMDHGSEIPIVCPDGVDLLTRAIIGAIETPEPNDGGSYIVGNSRAGYDRLQRYFAQ